MDITFYLYKGAGGHKKNLWITHEGKADGERIEIESEKNIGKVVQEYVEKHVGLEKVWD